MKPIKYVARYEGKIVGTRKSPRPYEYAVIVRSIEAYAREKAYGYTATDTDRANFHYFGELVAAGESHPHYRYNKGDENHWRAAVEGGFDAYIAGLRATEIERFEEHRAAGGFEPRVLGWSMSRHNAEKMAASARHPGREVLAIVPAETEK